MVVYRTNQVENNILIVTVDLKIYVKTNVQLPNTLCILRKLDRDPSLLSYQTDPS
jgi:hypothetical protein